MKSSNLVAKILCSSEKTRKLITGRGEGGGGRGIPDKKRRGGLFIGDLRGVLYFHRSTLIGSLYTSNK